MSPDIHFNSFNKFSYKIYIISRNVFPVLFVSFLSLSTIFMILYATSTYGMGISPDSVAYMAVAQNLTNGNGFSDYQGYEFVHWPPLFPIVLASIKLVSGVDLEEGARFFNALAAGCTLGLACFVLLRLVRGSLALLGGFSVLFNYPQVVVSTYVWSEPFFNLLVMIFLAIIISYNRLQRREVLLLGFVTALACLARYIGYSLLATGLILIVIRSRHKGTRLINLFLFGVISVLPTGIWLTRNLRVSGTLFGPRGPSRYSMIDNLYYTYTKVSSWLLPDRLLPYDRIIFIAIALGVLGGGVYAFVHKRAAKTLLIDLRRPAQISLFIAVYLACLIISSTISAHDQIDTRLLSPISIPLIITLILTLDVVLKWFENSDYIPRFSSASIIALFTLWLFIVPMRDVVYYIRKIVDQGIPGYNSQLWQQSETIEYVRVHLAKQDRAIYSNLPEAVFFLAGIQAQGLPERTYYNSEKPVYEDLSTLAGKWPSYPISWLIYFDTGKDYYFNINELNVIADISMVIELSDGTIYTVSPKQF